MERRGRWGDLWLPGLIGLLGVLISLAVWGILITNRRAVILESTTETVSQVRDAIESQLGQQIETLYALSALWSRFGLEPLPVWTAHVDERVNRVEGLDSVAWVDLDEPQDRIAAGQQRSAEAIELDVDEARRHSREPHIPGPEHDAAGAVVYRVFLPVPAPHDHAGVLVAHFRVEPFLRSVLQGRARGYALSLSWQGEEIFSRGAPSADPWQRWWRVEEEIAMPLGGRWSALFRPTPELAAARLTPVPHYLLAVGVLLSLVLAALAHQFRVITRQSRFLAVSNRALEQRGTELESRVAERTEALRDAIAELETFNYSVAHDLRSPLGAILNFTAILEEDYRGRRLDEAGMEMLARIRHSASRATSLIEDLLELSRAGRAALDLEPVDMSALARETFAQARAAEDDAEVELIVEPLPEAVGDRSLLGDVFTNLFSNALKYSRGCEKRRVTVRGSVAEGHCVYEVVDNGIGFDMRFASKLFGLFERLHSNERIEGTGIGLAMVARIVRRHGGRVWAEGHPGEGARFFFALPLRQAS